MKEIHRIEKDKIVIVKQAEQEKQNKLVGRIRPRKGHTLYEVNLNNGEINKAKFEKNIASYKSAAAGELSGKRIVMVNEGCIYVSALNVKNLIKKLIKSGYINA